jgi:riboflavin synthase
MFTGIIEDIGTVIKVEKGRLSAKLSIEASDFIFSDLKLGDSVAVNGVCLTVAHLSKQSFVVDVMHETLSRSNLSNLKSGSRVNLERALSVNSRFGGHIVSGHIDGVGEIVSIKKDDNAILFQIKTMPQVMKYIIEKGSIAIDGISLTVINLTDNAFSVAIIPHTSKNTTLSQKAISDTVNLENDIIGKYVERLMSHDGKNAPKSNITMEFIDKYWNDN